MKAVRLVQVTKVYPGAQPQVALKGVSLEVDEGEFISIVGPSGSGKTTLLNIIGALDRPTSGKVFVAENDISEMSDGQLAQLRNRYIGFVFQAYNLINRMTVLQNVELPLVIRGVPREERTRLALDALETVGLRAKAGRRPTELSGGEQQRVAIARAIVANPELILADEPTGNLDSKNAENVMGLMIRVNRELGKTIIMVTHNMDLARMTRKIVKIKDGEIQEVVAN